MANPTRFPFGWALGYYNQFNAYGRGGNQVEPSATVQYQQQTAGLIAYGNTAPDVSQGALFYTNNTSNTTITNFTVQQMGRAGGLLASGQVDTTAPLPEGKLITIFFLDNSTQLANNTSINLAGTDNLIGSANIITFMASNNKWYEFSRSKNTNAEVQTYTISAQSSINVDGTKVAIIVNTGGASLFLSALSGGQVGQRVTIMTGTSGLSLFVQTGGNIAIQGTNAYLIASSGAYDFVKRSGTRWNMIHIGTTGIA